MLRAAHPAPAAGLCVRERLIIFGAALATRLVWVVVVGELPAGDAADYDEIALNVLSGDGFVARENWFGFSMYSWRAPAYPLVLTALYGLLGYSHLPVLILQSFIGAATAVLIFDLARALHPPSALLAGGFTAVYEPLVRVTCTVSTEPLFIFLMVLAVRLLTRSHCVSADGDDRAAGWVLCGLAIGAAALTRPVGLLLWPVQVLMWYSPKRRRAASVRSSTRRTLWLSLGVILALTPWTLRNYRIHEALIPISTHGGFIFARSNAPEPDWKKGEQGWRIGRELFVSMPTEMQRNRYWFAQGLESIRSNPAHYVRLAGEKFLRFWYFYEPEYNLWFMSLLPFFAAGWGRYWRRDRYSLISALACSTVATFCLVLYAPVRFRLALEPFFIVFATSFVRDFWDRHGTKRTIGAIGTVVVANGVLWWQGEALRKSLLLVLVSWGLG